MRLAIESEHVNPAKALHRHPPVTRQRQFGRRLPELARTVALVAPPGNLGTLDVEYRDGRLFAIQHDQTPVRRERHGGDVHEQALRRLVAYVEFVGEAGRKQERRRFTSRLLVHRA